MTAPAWTAREWRPLARDLCAQVLGVQRPVSQQNASTATESDDRKHQQRLLLRADKLVAKMYAHKYMDITPQQIRGEVEEIATKMDIHLLPERAVRLRHLVSGCDYRVMKLLLELAVAPTSASDARVAVDAAAPLEALQAWNQLLSPSKDEQKIEAKARQEAALAATLEAELLQVAWEDDWWKERQDDDASEFDDALEDDSEGLDEMMSESDDGFVRGIASTVLAAHETTPSEMHVDDTAGDSEGLTDGQDDDVDEEDLLMLQYYRRATDPADDMEVKEAGVDQTQLRRDGKHTFSLEVPSSLLPQVESVNEYRRVSHRGVAQQPPEPRRIVHERVLVEAVFYALRGVPSALFETRKAQTSLFDGDFCATEFTPSALVQRGISVSHLSPITMVGVLQEITSAASDLQFLRDVAAFLSTNPSNHARSTAAEGLSYGIYRELHSCEQYIRETQESMVSVTRSANQGESDGFEHNKRSVLPTLLAAIGSFQDMFAMASWLKSTLNKCLEKFQTRCRADVPAAELSCQLLSALYHDLQVEFIETAGASCNGENRPWNSYEILCKVFAGALGPYLDVMDRMIFERGYDARIHLQPELFFVAPGGGSSTPVSPRSSAQRQVEESFEEAMAVLMPYRVDVTKIPTFIKPLERLLSAALESRQILNQYLNQQAAHQDNSKQTPGRLSDVFGLKFAQLTSKSKLLNSLDSTPFDEAIRQAVVQPVTDMCVSINGTIANLFRDKLHFQEHMETLRLFLLMHQQDVFTELVQFLIEQIQLDPVGWAKSESINACFQDSIQRLHVEGLISNDQRDIAARISIRVDIKELKKLRITRHIDIMAIRHLNFKFSTPQPLRVLFSGSIVDKYSKLAILLLQVKLVELILTNFKQNFRHRMCFLQTQDALRSQLVQLADMLHYTRAVLNYLANQMTGDAWSKVERVIRQSKSIREINVAHEEYLGKMLNSFFVLKKHEGFTRQFMQNFNDIIAYGSRVDDFVRSVERNMSHYFNTAEGTSTTDGRSTFRRDGTRQRDLVPNDEFRALYTKLQRSLKNPEGNYENQLHVITIVLDAMVKNGASPHVNELLILLTFNGFRSPSRSRLPTSR